MRTSPHYWKYTMSECFYADTLKGGCQWKYQDRKQMIYSMTHLLSVTNWQRCLKHCFEAKTCKPEAFSGCCFEFLWLDFWSPLSLQRCFVADVILWESCVHEKSNFIWRALDVLLDSSVSSAANYFSKCSGSSERCHDSLPALLCMRACKHGCTWAVVKFLKLTWFSCKERGREFYGTYNPRV